MCAPSDIFLALLAVLFPPIAVWIKTGICSGASLVNIILCVLGYLPGLLHAWYIIASVPDEAGGAVVAYYYDQPNMPADPEAARGFHSRVPGPAGQRPLANGYVAPPPQLGPRADNPARTYGTVDAGSSAPPPQEQGAPQGAPPSYDQAVRGDNKVQK